VFAAYVLSLMSVQCCADPALPPIEQDGESISITLEPAKRYQRPYDPTTVNRVARHGRSINIGASRDILPKLSASLRGCSW